MNRSALLAFGCALVLVPLPARADDADEKPEIVKSKEETEFSLDGLIGLNAIWELTPEKAETDYKKAGFKWLTAGSKERAIIRPKWMWIETEKSPPGGRKPSRFMDTRRSLLQFFGGKVEAEEVNFEFKAGKLAMLNVSVWNKGDSEEITAREFQLKVDTLSAALTGWFGRAPQDLGRDPKSASKAIRARWETANLIAQLEHSSEKDKEFGFLGEFIRVRFAPKTKMVVGDAAASGAKVNQSSLVAHVKKLPNGDVYVDDVPMVDQGDKGYCALASSERVMRYYGIDCDQHDMAQASGSDACGTGPEELQDALHRLQNRFRIRVRDIIHWDVRDYERFTSVYNREAKRVGARPCPDGYVWASFYGLDKDVLREARTKGIGYEKFTKSVLDFTSRGVPLLWGLELGIYPENGQKALQFGGGHMRLILGYNQKTDELIFSDSWGAGHELKRMAMRDAYVVTRGLYMIEPQAR